MTLELATKYLMILEIAKRIFGPSSINTMDVRGAVYKGDEDEEDDVLGGGPVPARTRAHDCVEQRRRNFRSATFNYSSDRTTIEDMADHVISRLV